MNLSRRAFLGGALALTAVAAANLPVVASVPKIVGDGIHDDTIGLQALFDGRPFMVENEAVVAKDGFLQGGKFLITKALEITRDNIDITGGHFIRSGHGNLVFNISGAGNCRLSFSHVEYANDHKPGPDEAVIRFRSGKLDMPRSRAL